MGWEKSVELLYNFNIVKIALSLIIIIMLKKMIISVQCLRLLGNSLM